MSSGKDRRACPQVKTTRMGRHCLEAPFQRRETDPFLLTLSSGEVPISKAVSATASGRISSSAASAGMTAGRG